MAALFNTGYGFMDLHGKIRGQRFYQARGQGVVQSFVRPARKKTVNNFRDWRDLAEAQARWETLTVDQQDDWDEFAAVTQLNDIVGLNTIVDGEHYFVVFNTNRRTFNDALDWIDDAPALPTWGTRPKFQPFIAKETDNKLWFTAQTAFPAGTRIAAFAQPPSLTAPYLKRVELIWLGTIVFDTGLAANQQTDAFTAVYKSAFGMQSTERPLGNWFLLWEIQEGYMRCLKDPCVTPDSDTPRSLTLDWNDTHPDGFLYMRDSKIKSSNGLSLGIGGSGPWNASTYKVIASFPHFVAPGPSSAWSGSWYCTNGHGGSFSVAITYPFTSLVTA